LSPLRSADIADLHALWTSPGVRRYLGDNEASATAEGKIAGFGGYWHFRDPPELELLYGVAEPLWGRGLATELARAMVDYAWAALGFLELNASTDVGNIASARVLEKLGFTLARRAVVGGLDTFFCHLTRPPGDRVLG
jgi:ribosomal-protein-alanine N-acetyltransferase